MSDDKERQLIENASKLLDQSTERISLRVSMRLQQAQREALSAAAGKSEMASTEGRTVSFPTWVSPASMSLLAAVMLLIFAVGWINPQSINTPGINQYDDMQLLSSVNDIEMYKNLDFYIWLDNENTDS